MKKSAGTTETSPRSEPKLRHEFVGMLFAVTIGEVGLQTAGLIQEGHFWHYLPAYAHLLLATVLIATSWVGWTLSQSPGARIDVESVFEPGFLVLLVDVLLVICYFIVVRLVDFSKESPSKSVASAAPEALWILIIFCLYLVWDFLTKVVVFVVKRDENLDPGSWPRLYGSRILPTLVCIGVACGTRRLVEHADPPHVLVADIALLALILLFRALKDVISAIYPRRAPRKPPKLWLKWTNVVACVVLWLIAAWWTLAGPMPQYVSTQILQPVLATGQVAPGNEVSAPTVDASSKAK